MKKPEVQFENIPVSAILKLLPQIGHHF